MLSVLEEPAIRARVPAFSVANYHRLFELGMLSPKLELIRGALVEQMLKSPLHSSIVVLLSQDIPPHLPTGWRLRSEQPLTFSDSEPEPDIAIVQGPESAYFRSHPTKAALVIEVVVSSEALDRLKLEIYAEAGVPECWLLLAEERALERHIEPNGAAYQKIERVSFPEVLVSTSFPSLSLPPASLLTVER